MPFTRAKKSLRGLGSRVKAAVQAFPHSSHAREHSHDAALDGAGDVRPRRFRGLRGLFKRSKGESPYVYQSAAIQFADCAPVDEPSATTSESSELDWAFEPDWLGALRAKHFPEATRVPDYATSVVWGRERTPTPERPKLLPAYECTASAQSMLNRACEGVREPCVVIPGHREFWI